MSFAKRRNRIQPDRASSVVVALVALFLTACGSPAASSVPVAESDAASPAASTSASPSASVEADEPCLPAQAIAAIEEIRGGNFEPDVPLSEIADAVEALDPSALDDPAFAELLQDDLVEKLREPNQEDMSGLGRAVSGFSSEVLPEIAEC